MVAQKYLLIVLLFTPLCANAKPDTTAHNSSLYASVSAGKVIAHHTILSSLNNGITLGTEISYKSTLKQHDNLAKYWGLHLNASRYGNANLGYSISITPIVTAPILSAKRTKVFLSVGSGIGLVTKRYNPISNPTNYSFSTPINIAAKVELETNVQISPRRIAFVKVVAHHISNGNTKKPNYGLNSISLAAGVQLGSPWPNAPVKEARLNFPSQGQFSITASAGYREAGDYGGKRYAVGSVKLSYKLLQWENNGLLTGTDLMLDKASLFHLERDGTSHSGNIDAFKLGLNAGIEKQINRISLSASCGVYVHRKDTTGGFLYQHIAINYWITRYLATQLSLKTHWTTADYLELGLRVRI